jgi:metallo-beta-lactamase family protein
VRGAIARRGVVIVPAFAVGRTQELLWRLRRLEASKRIPALPVFLDSPMAIEVTEIYRRHRDAGDRDMRTAADDSVQFPAGLRLIRTVEESKSLNALGGPMIIIAGSGMATGGRVLHHMEKRLANPSTTILLTGFQAAGTRGRALQEGAPALKMHGTFVTVAATVATVNGLSAHADREETLAWLSRFRRAPRRTYAVHGEPKPAEALAAAIRERLRWNVEVAADGATVALETTTRNRGVA